MTIDLTPEPGQPRDTRLIERAVRKRWPIDEAYRDAIVKRQVAIAINPTSSPREATAAARCIVGMDAQNLEEEKRFDVVRHEHSGSVTIDAQRNELLSLLATVHERVREAEAGVDPERIESNAIPETEQPDRPGGISLAAPMAEPEAPADPERSVDEGGEPEYISPADHHASTAW